MPSLNPIPSKASHRHQSIASSLPDNGDPFGTRAWLAERGVTFGFVHTTEALAQRRRRHQARHHLRRQAGGDGRHRLRPAGRSGRPEISPTASSPGQRRTGRNLVGNLNTISNIEALPTTRLSEMWLQQTFLGGMASLRAGQLVVDTEFLFSQYFSFFISSDWPTNPAVNIPSGGAAYPLSTPGIRFKVDPTPQTTFLLSVLNGDPAGQCGLNDPEQRNRHGLNFRVNDPPYLIGEFQYRYNQDPTFDRSCRRRPLRRVASLRPLRRPAFRHQRLFAGESARAPASPAGCAAMTASMRCSISNCTVRPAATRIPACCCSAAPPTVRPTAASNDFYLDGGIIFAGMIPSRPADAFGASFLYAHMSNQARGLDRDTRLFTGLPVPVARLRAVVRILLWRRDRAGLDHLSQRAADFPSGRERARRQRSPTEPIRNAVVIGVRSVMQY